MTDQLSASVNQPTNEAAVHDAVRAARIEQQPVKLEAVYRLEEQDSNIPTQIVLKCEDAFLVADTRGDLPGTRREIGLFWHGTRYLRSCNLFIEGRAPVLLSYQVSARGDACLIEATNAPFTAMQGQHIEQGAIHVRRELILHPDKMEQQVTLTNYSMRPISIVVALKVGSNFYDLFEVRGARRKDRGTLEPPECSPNRMILRYRGLDHILRETRLTFNLSASEVHADRLFWQIELLPHQPVALQVNIQMHETDVQSSVAPIIPLHPETAARGLTPPRVQTDDPIFNQLLARCMSDVQMLATYTPQGLYPYAGIPWFACPFGRDALITCLEYLPLFPELTRGTLAFLAAHQGTTVDLFTNEEPGKILHECRTGEMANCREIPFIPYYGTVDATPLFLILCAHYIRWTNDLTFLRLHWDNVLAAARWMTDYGDRDGDGFIEYQRSDERGLGNQGWKDAGDAISYSSGALAVAPIALCEVQGYAFVAYEALSYLSARLDKVEQAQAWLALAEQVRENFVHDFWWEQEQTFYLALDGKKNPCDVVSSNAGQCLWTGIVPPEKATLVVQRLMRADMYSGWGIRTLAMGTPRYNPLSYHNGSVWPHDTALIGAGFARYGHKKQAAQLLRDLYDASRYFEAMRLPELYCGFSRQDGYGPTRYPVACSPQAWAAGAPMLLLHSLLGWEPDVEHNTLLLHQPMLPDWLSSIEVQGIRIGERTVHMRFIRTGTKTEVVLDPGNEVNVRLI
jgi:glycogen debranching enzyme